MGARESFVDRWSEAPWWDFAAAALAVAIHLIVVHAWGRGDWLKWADSGQRTSVYGTAAGVVSAIGGLSSIAISIYTASEGPRARSVRRNFPVELRRNWRSLLTGTALICFLCLIAQSMDDPRDLYHMRYVFEFAMLLAVARFLRMLWLFDAIMKISDRDASDPDPALPLVMDPNWAQRRQGDTE